MLEMVTGAALVIAGMGMGRFWPARKRTPRPPKPVCGCGHDLAMHEPDGDGGGTACHGTDTKDAHSIHGNWIGYKQVPCGCRQYTGPRILDPGFVARELTDDAR